jgi:antitoxin (DNA-binding transcriptional repressor) of toxin-antitoxin stability system
VTIFSVPDAEAIFDELIERVLAGEDIFVDYGDGRLVKIVPVKDKKLSSYLI